MEIKNPTEHANFQWLYFIVAVAAGAVTIVAMLKQYKLHTMQIEDMEKARAKETATV